MRDITTDFVVYSKCPLAVQRFHCQYSYVNIFALFQIKWFTRIVRVGVIIWIDEVFKPAIVRGFCLCY